MEFGIFPCIIIIIRYFEDTLGSSYKKYKVNLIFCGWGQLFLIRKTNSIVK